MGGTTYTQPAVVAEQDLLPVCLAYSHSVTYHISVLSAAVTQIAAVLQFQLQERKLLELYSNVVCGPTWP